MRAVTAFKFQPPAIVAAPLTAELCARALVAAADAYGDDPVEAIRARDCAKRRALTAAVLAVGAAVDLSPEAIGKVFGVDGGTVRKAEKRGGDGFDAALAAAYAAVGLEGDPTPIAPHRLGALIDLLEARLLLRLARPAADRIMPRRLHALEDRPIIEHERPRELMVGQVALLTRAVA